MMYDYNLMGSGYVYADIRNVCAPLCGETESAFLAEYGGIEQIDPMEKLIDDDVISPIAAPSDLCGCGQLPRWTEAYQAQFRDGR